jgi:hypothetical protein
MMAKIYIADHERFEAAGVYADRLSSAQIEFLKDNEGDYWLWLDLAGLIRLDRIAKDKQVFLDGETFTVAFETLHAFGGTSGVLYYEFKERPGELFLASRCQKKAVCYRCGKVSDYLIPDNAAEVTCFACNEKET